MSVKTISSAILRKHLQSLTKDKLIVTFSKVYSLYPEIGEYFQSLLHTAGKDEITQKYKKIIHEEFFPARGLPKARLSVVRKAVQQCCKLVDEYKCIDIMVYYVEQGAKFTMAYGDIDEQFYSSMESMYEDAIIRAKRFGLLDNFIPRLRKIVEDTYGCGWGFYDGLSDTFETYCSSV